MKITVQREPSENGRTYGKLFLDGVYFCETLEDQIRETAEPVAKWKIRGQTAIPSGEYSVILSDSQHFARVLPELLRVPGYVGVRIHPGNTASQTEGCILVGKERGDLQIGAKKVNAVLQSQIAFKSLYERLVEATVIKDPITISVINPPAA